MEKHSHMESTEEQMLAQFHTQFPCRGAAGQRWKDVHQIRGCQPQRGHLRWQLCANRAHVHLVHTGRFWQVFTSTAFSFSFLDLSLTSTWSRLRHLMLRAVPVLSSSSEARARCASWVFRNTTLGNCFKCTRLLKWHAEFQQFKLLSPVVSFQETPRNYVFCDKYIYIYIIFTNLRWRNKCRRQPSREHCERTVNRCGCCMT